MAESIKSVLWKKENVVVDGKQLHKYLIGIILVTDQEIEKMMENDNVVMHHNPTDLNPLSNLLSTYPKFKPPFTLGDLSDAMLDISGMQPDELLTEDEGNKE